MSKTIHTIEFIPNPTQKQFIESRAEADIFMGRMGEGKSAALAWAAYHYCRHNPGAEFYLIRDTWENLRATTWKEFTFWFPPKVMGTWHNSNKEFTWASGVAEGVVGFLGMDDPQDAGKLQSRFMGGFGMDEPAPAMSSGGIPEEIFDIAMTRLRQQGMSYYVAKLATNNPDETHWTYRRFVDPGEPGFRYWQSAAPENERNLPPDYYLRLRRHLGHRSDLLSRFVEGRFGVTQEGLQVTPEWDDRLHLATSLSPVRGQGLTLLWDFGLNPTCIITQVTPLRDWLVFDALVGEDIGVEELITYVVRPLLASKYRGLPLTHIGDPAGAAREQSSSRRSAVLSLRRELGGVFRRGPVPFLERREPLRAILARQRAGRGVLQVDRVAAKAVWQALRGGWHFHVSRTGVPSAEPIKNIHSHPGDAMGYGAAILFPTGRLQQPTRIRPVQSATFFGGARVQLPPEARVLGS